jgi:hypothetical protein
VWNLHVQAKDYQKSPSELVGFVHPWVRYQFDRAVFALGNRVESRLNETDKKTGKRKWTVKQVLAGEADRRISVGELFLRSGQDVMGF